MLEMFFAMRTRAREKERAWPWYISGWLLVVPYQAYQQLYH